MTGFKWPVGVTRAIDAPATEVWSAISMPGNLEPCHPFCARNPVREWPGVGSRDEVHYLNGRVYERRFTNWIEGEGYDLEIGESGGEESFVSWRIAPIGVARCSLAIVVYPYLLQRVPVAIRWLPHVARVRPLLTSFLTSVVQGFDWYVPRGEPVPRNHWGTHPWFSS